MGRGRIGWVVRVAAAAIVLVAAGCRSTPAKPVPFTTDPTIPVPTESTVAATTITTVDLSIIPNPITVAYLDAVLAALNHVDGNAARLVQASGKVTDEAIALVQSIGTPAEVTVSVQSLAGIPGSAAALRVPMGDFRSSVREILSATPNCVAFLAVDEGTAVRIDPLPAAVNAYRLRPRDQAQTPTPANPTPYAIDTHYASPNGADAFTKGLC